jgi:hypothetical protein
MPPISPNATRERLSSDALLILKTIKENARSGRVNKLIDVKSALEHSVQLDFEAYFFFLRKFNYVAMDREAHLRLTEDGDLAVVGTLADRFIGEIGEFFVDQLAEARTRADDVTRETTLAPSTSARSVRRTSMPEEPSALQPTRTDETRAPAAVPAAAPPPPPPPPFPLTTVASGSLPMANPARLPELDLRYQKLDQLGVGPLATIFKAKHNALGIDVCVKELKDIFGYFSFLQRGEVVKRLRREVSGQAQVRHPGVVQVFDQNADAARPYFVMELCQGNLKEKLEATSGNKLGLDAALRYFLQMVYALKAAHEQGVLHHNLKPENVLFDAYGNAKVSDFGLSRVIEVDPAKGMPHVFVGTGGMAYLSPELLNREKEPGAASDVYSMGIILFEMLTGLVPGRRSPVPSQVNHDVPKALDAVFDRMTCDRRDERYPDFSAVLDDVCPALDSRFPGRGDLLLSGERK